MEAGVTTFADMYFFMERRPAVRESGLRADLSVGMTGLDPKAGEKSLGQAAEFVQSFHGTLRVVLVAGWVLMPPIHARGLSCYRLSRQRRN